MQAASLVRRINEVRDRSQIISILNDIFAVVSDESTSTILRTAILQALIENFKPSFIGLLTFNEITKRLGKIFTASPIEDSIILLMNSLRNCNRDNLWYTLTILLHVEENGLSKLLCKSLSKDPSDVHWSSLVSELSVSFKHFPDVLHNFSGEITTPYSKDKDDKYKSLSKFLSNHWSCLSQSMKIALNRAKEMCDNSEDVNLRLLTALVPTILSNLKIFSSFIDWLENYPSSITWEHLSAKLLSDTANGILFAEKLVQNVVICTKNGRSLHKLFGDEIVNSRIIKRTIFHKMLLIRVYDQKDNIPKKLAQCLKIGNMNGTSNDAWNVLHIETIHNLLDAWADTAHILHSSDEQRTYVAIALLYFVKYASEHIRSLIGQKVSDAVLAGVETHLKCIDCKRRFRGLYVAELLLGWLSIGDLHFDYPANIEDDLSDLRKIDQENINDINDTREVNETNFQTTTETAPIESDLAKEAVEPTVRSDTLDSDDDDDFPHYQLPERELHPKIMSDDDLYVPIENRVNPPKYIRDCCEMLNEKENYAKFEVAFNTLNQLIRRRVVAYDEIAENLIIRLINLSDNFKTPDFEVKRQEMIVSCLVMSPQLASIAISTMYSRNCCMYNRFVILESLSAAATELSNPPSSSKSHIVDSKPLVNIETSWRQIIDERIKAKSRHFRSATSESNPVKNRFANLAKVFFYPLTVMEQHREHLDLLNIDYMLLAKILFTLGHILQCAKNCTCAPNMASTLVEYLRPLRYHEQCSVRQSVLFCYCSICLSLTSSVLLELFTNSLHDWMDYAQKMADNDPSKECRELALITGKCIFEQLNSGGA